MLVQCQVADSHNWHSWYSQNRNFLNFYQAQRFTGEGGLTLCFAFVFFLFFFFLVLVCRSFHPPVCWFECQVLVLGWVFFFRICNSCGLELKKMHIFNRNFSSLLFLLHLQRDLLEKQNFQSCDCQRENTSDKLGELSIRSVSRSRIVNVSCVICAKICTLKKCFQ